MKKYPQKTGPPKHLSPDSLTIITSAGNVVKATTLSRYNLTQTIQKLEGGDEYVVVSTGEVKEIQHTENRAESADPARKPFQKLAMLINANTTIPSHCRFVSLAYAENMTDTKNHTTILCYFSRGFAFFLKKGLRKA